jgi:hypothetical protein
VPGGYREVVRPDPIPNSVVKRSIGDDNVLARVCENTSLPDLIKPSLKEGFLLLNLQIVYQLFFVINCISEKEKPHFWNYFRTSCLFNANPSRCPGSNYHLFLSIHTVRSTQTANLGTNYNQSDSFSLYWLQIRPGRLPN